MINMQLDEKFVLLTAKMVRHTLNIITPHSTGDICVCKLLNNMQSTPMRDWCTAFSLLFDLCSKKVFIFYVCFEAFYLCVLMR